MKTVVKLSRKELEDCAPCEQQFEDDKRTREDIRKGAFLFVPVCNDPEDFQVSSFQVCNEHKNNFANSAEGKLLPIELTD